MAFDNQPLEFQPGDTVALAIVRSGQHPQHGGTLCLAGDCGNCSADVNGVAYTRTCLTAALPGLTVKRHPAVGGPPLRLTPPPVAALAPNSVRVQVNRAHRDVVIVGAGDSGRAAAAEQTNMGRNVTMLDSASGDDVVGVYPGPMIVVRQQSGLRSALGRRVEHWTRHVCAGRPLSATEGPARSSLGPIPRVPYVSTTAGNR